MFGPMSAMSAISAISGAIYSVVKERTKSWGLLGGKRILLANY